MTDLDRALESIERSDCAHFIGPREPALVSAAESTLGVQFPPTYRRYVRELGAGSVGGHEIYGVTTDNFSDASVPNSVWLTLAEREELGLPVPFIIVGDTGMGEYYVIDTSRQDGSGESPVCIWSPDAPAGSDLEVVATDFGSFLWDAVVDAIG